MKVLSLCCLGFVFLFSSVSFSAPVRKNRTDHLAKFKKEEVPEFQKKFKAKCGYELRVDYDYESIREASALGFRNYPLERVLGVASVLCKTELMKKELEKALSTLKIKHVPGIRTKMERENGILSIITDLRNRDVQPGGFEDLIKSSLANGDLPFIYRTFYLPLFRDKDIPAFQEKFRKVCGFEIKVDYDLDSLSSKKAFEFRAYPLDRVLWAINGVCATDAKKKALAKKVTTLKINHEALAKTGMNISNGVFTIVMDL